MIKPSHYNDDGYPIQWWRTIIPSNSLACIYGLAQDCAQRRVLGDDVEIRLHAVDETNTRVNPKKLISMIGDDKAMVAMVGVQSNQFPRAVDLSQPFLERGIPVCMGGFHVSGCLAMLDETPDDIKAAQDMGISMFLGEAEEGEVEAQLTEVGQLKSQELLVPAGVLRHLTNGGGCSAGVDRPCITRLCPAWFTHSLQ